MKPIIRQLIHRIIIPFLLLFALTPSWAVSDTTISKDVPYDGLYNLPIFEGVEIIEWRDDKGNVLTRRDSLGDKVNDFTPEIYTTDTTIYTVTYIDPTDKINLIYNGDFEAPLNDEEADELSEYIFVSPGDSGAAEGFFGIGDNPRDLKPNNNWCSIIEDHTEGNNASNMLYADGGQTHLVIYNTPTTEDVEKGKKYILGGYYASINDKNPYRINYSINGSSVHSFNYPNSNKVWNYHYAIWTANQTGTADIKIINNHNTNDGNDFAIDDLAFFPTKEYTITFIPKNIPPNAPDYWFDTFGASMIKDNIAKDIWDANGDRITIDTIPIRDTEHGKVTIYKDGSFTYHPTSKIITQDDWFSYEVCDSIGDCNQGTVHITVNETLLIDTLTKTITCGDNGSLMLGCVTALDTPYLYSFYYDTIIQKKGFEDVLPDTITPEQFIDSTTIQLEIPLPTDVRMDSYYGNLSFEYSLHKTQVLGVNFYTRYPSNILAQKWDNVVAVLNKNYNGGYDFEDFTYQWLKDGIPIPNETSKLLYLTDLAETSASEYSVLLTDPANNSTIETCPIKMTTKRSSKKSSASPTISVSPSVTLPQGLLELQTSKNTGTIKIWDIQGQLQYQVEINSPTQFIQAPLKKGFYMVGVSNKEGHSDIKRIIVR